MKPTKQLIRALRETAADLRNKAKLYNWGSITQCNCGLLAQKITGIARDNLLDSLAPLEPGHWTHMAKQTEKCLLTNRPLSAVFATLLAAGVELEDFKRIEYLDDGEGIPITDFHQDRNKVAEWMDAQADLLEQRRVAKEV